MATILSQVPLTASGNVLLVATAQGAGPAGWRVTFLGDSWTGSVVLANNRGAPGQAVSLTNIAYLTASTGATNTAGTAITASGDYIIPLTSCAYDLYAVYTHTSGSAAVKVLTEDAGGGGGDLTAAEVDGSASQNVFGAAVPYTGAYTFPGALAITGALTGVTQGTFSTKLVSTTALATPSALAATAFNAFASTVSGAVLMGYGTTGDVTLKNRAGTDVAYVGPNTTKFWMVGDVDIGAGKFTVAAATGNTVVAGTLQASGLSSLLGGGAVGSSTATGTASRLIINGLANATANIPYLNFQAAGTSKVLLGFSGAILGTTALDLAFFAETGLGIEFYVNGSGTKSFGIASTGAATFASTVAVTSWLSIAGAAASQSAGVLSIGNTTQTTVGAAGGASALPATPTGYIKTYIGATQYVIPYYAQA